MAERQTHLTQNETGKTVQVQVLLLALHGPADEVGSYRFPFKEEFAGSIPVWAISHSQCLCGRECISSCIGKDADT